MKIIMRLGLFCVLLLISFQSCGQDSIHQKQWESAFNNGIKQLNDNKFSAALKYLNDAYALSITIFQKNEEEYGDTVSLLGDTHNELKNRELAIFFYSEKLEYLRLNDRSNELQYAQLLKKIGTLYRYKGDFKKSLENLAKSLEIVELIEGTNSIEYSKLLLTISIVYKKAGDYNNAIAYNKQSNKLREQLFGIKSIEYLQSLTSLSQIYIEVGEYKKASIILENVSPQLKRIDPTGKYLQAIFTKSVLHHYKYEYEKEILLYEEVKRSSKKGDGAYTSANSNLAVAYEELGDYENALKIALEVANNTSSSDSNYPIRLQNLAYVYAELGEYNKALNTYEQALESCRNIFGTKHPLYAKLIDCIGQLHFFKGDLELSKDYFIEALTVITNNFDENYYEYRRYLNNYTKTLLKLNQHDKAINLIRKNIKISENNSNTNNIDYFKMQLALAEALNEIGNHESALPILLEYSIKIKDKLGSNHSDYSDFLKSTMDAYIGLKDFEKAITIMDLHNNAIVSQIDEIFRFRSEKEKKSFLNRIIKIFDSEQSIALNIKEPIGKLDEINLNNQIMLKGLLLNNSKNILTNLSALDDAKINSEIKDYRLTKYRLSEALSNSKEHKITDTDSLKNLVNKQESELVKLNSLHFKNTIDLKKSWKESKLNKNEIAIEFSRFRFFRENNPTDSIYYVAYVYKKNWKHPKMVRLFEEKKLKSLLANKKPNQLYASRGSKGFSVRNTVAIYDLVWNPLVDYLKDSATIYYSPSGLLNQISFAALGKRNSNSLGEKFNLIQLSNTGVLENLSDEPNTTSALLIGGVNYNEVLNNSQENNKVSTLLKDEKQIDTLASENWEEKWKSLPGALKEVNALNTILKSKGIKTNSWSGTEASETNFKKLSGKSPNIIHIATHGFFYENIKETEAAVINSNQDYQYNLADDPLLRSGLVLAGANNAIKNNKLSGNDGILTAMEISNMDLSNTDIVVLSACETGLGDIDGSEGVYGLQRAFKMAGVDIIVMSLWEVPDIETAEFMNLFYQNWLKSKKVKDAFISAQRTMQTKYKTEPEKWAAFVLFE